MENCPKTYVGTPLLVGVPIRICWLRWDKKESEAEGGRIMGENPTLPNRQIVHLLGENGINRSREWVRQNRVSGN